MCASHWEEIVHTKEILAGHPLVTGGWRGVLYARNCQEPHLVPVPLMIGIEEMKSTDDLYTCQWVNEYGRDLPAIIQPRRNRLTIQNHPHSKCALPWTLEICTESKTTSLHNNLLALLAQNGQIHPLLEKAPIGNILVLKQGKTDANEVQDVNRADIAQITDVIVSNRWIEAFVTKAEKE
ncbi:uncharacterized protein F5147DRAFT_658108 [Suillus discolor]|uniref:Uncharacterized protein n=1 Tax=Suillus discolor TaxID=1912936 RepID=A0A9P7EV86_9AGAM|nr:uncharacterized protein F5147DRAFT_658108 [Suillus discolor]KAG2090588.1 hypothetical protein F5147DRAFT_658108 [Suillus discolor]